METAAESHKTKGNVYFGQQLYEKAIDEYSTAIIKNPQVHIYYTNRALVYFKLCQFSKCTTDCEKAIELEPHSVKGWYLFGKSLTCQKLRLSEAVSALRKAYNYALEQKVTFVEDILTALKNAKKAKWEIADKKRRENENDLYRYLNQLVERDRQRQIEQVGVQDKDAIDAIKQAHDERLSQIEALFAQVDENSKKREVPDYFCGKITMELMTDPVITPSGITYDRPELLQHLNTIGSFDPISRQPLKASNLIPNLAIKEAIEGFVEKNGWAVDY